ncbi:tRNA pseudouridine(38/39) synthase [Zancudomyces culisetae]|uniref:tRNA pseudouridine(38/39) synthase n=1 Tax=Zancudomyces culisetae TaxID=1213189 RepID=A0A1R1PJX5_ZANCU|nr:tRNA pseudouridine(38/39) synthase [Zancudomyces culisetae]|eukprot:OMH81280.1 tRNA pseudouridine(38/39) synthase [Zancudomyces culisetae]
MSTSNLSTVNGCPVTEYDNVERSNLIARIQQLETELSKRDLDLKKLRNKLSTQNRNIHMDYTDRRKDSKKNKSGEFDIKKYPRRKIALKVSYFGWDYYGFTKNGNLLDDEKGKEEQETWPTVEGELFIALKRCHMIVNEADCDYSRCGRTDKGVSGFGQVISLYVRTKGEFVEQTAGDSDQELYMDPINNGKAVKLPSEEAEFPYPKMLNSLLPQYIRVIAWSPVNSEFSARFSCKARQYRYIFPKQNLDIEAMNKAAQLYMGTHDFRNFCKLDLGKNIKNFERTILEAKVVPLEFSPLNPFFGDSKEMGSWYQFRVKGTAFLWHQVRCLVAILFLVGQGLESPSIISKMMDINCFSGKPEYEMASDIPLILEDCEYSESDVNWVYFNGNSSDYSSLTLLDKGLNSMWQELGIKAITSTLLLYKMNTLPLVSQASTTSEDVGSESSLTCWQDLRKTNLSNSKAPEIIAGGGKVLNIKNYIPIEKRKCNEPVELRNKRFREKMALKLPNEQL